MNNRPNSDPLDRLLRDWAEEQSPTDADLKRLASRIVQSVDDRSSAAGASVPQESTTRWRPQPVASIALVAAAVVLLAFGFFWRARTDVETTANDQSDVPPAYLRLQDQQLRNKLIVLREMESFFDRKLNWLAETADSVQLGLERQLPASDAQALAVRLVVERRKPGQRLWTVAWSVDVVARSEEVIRMEPDSSGDSPLTMWAYVLPDGMIALDTELDLVDLALRSTTSEVQSNRESREVFTSATGEFEFRVFQTAAVLEDPVS